RDQQVHAMNAADRISRCTADLKAWLIYYNLLLNENKTEVIVLSAVNTRNCSQPHMNADVDICGCPITPKISILDIGVMIDSTMSMSAQF
ncbi:MAG: hypothetical protein M3H12_15045, partial [Chromatiales bacterium]